MKVLVMFYVIQKEIDTYIRQIHAGDLTCSVWPNEPKLKPDLNQSNK
jgi:hypothetical protein